jgi:hypothetical protein
VSTPPTDRAVAPSSTQDLVWNDVAGGTGGDPFTATSDEYPVQRIEVWKGNGPGDHLILFGLRITFFGGANEVQSFGTTNGYPNNGYELLRKEQLTLLIIQAGEFVDGIEAKTDQGGFSFGGSGGSEHDQDLGSGTLVGFTGRSGTMIDGLGAIFLE